MSPGIHVRVKEEWRQAYRRPGAELTGLLLALSPTGTIGRVRMDELGDSYLCVAHLEQVGPRR